MLKTLYAKGTNLVEKTIPQFARKTALAAAGFVGLIKQEQEEHANGFDVGYETPFIDKDHVLTLDKIPGEDFNKAADLQKAIDAARGVVSAKKDQNRLGLK